jgi:hypothetical protein
MRLELDFLRLAVAVELALPVLEEVGWCIGLEVDGRISRPGRTTQSHSQDSCLRDANQDRRSRTRVAVARGSGPGACAVAAKRGSDAARELLRAHSHGSVRPAPLNLPNPERNGWPGALGLYDQRRARVRSAIDGGGPSMRGARDQV